MRNCHISIAVSARLDELENNSSLIDENIFIGSDIDIENLQFNKTVRSKIEIIRELIELKEITGEYYDTNIFD